jgi:hypothetical protein
MTYSNIGLVCLLVFLLFFAFGPFLVELIPYDSGRRLKRYFQTKTTNTNKENHHDH